MSEDLSREAEELFKRVVDAAAGDRVGIVDAACRARPDLRREVGSLLTAFSESEGFLEAPVLGGRNERRARHAQAMTGRRIGRYRITSVIASGGMGTVFLAEQDQPRRTVALKVMRSRLASPSAVRRFEHEAEILARLRHPHIAHVYEAGRSRDELDGDGEDVPFIAMEYLAGAAAITVFAERRGLAVPERLALFRLVTDAVHYAHQNGIIHRDLKPSNILVDETGQPKVIDFGVARAVDPHDAASTAHTGVGELVGTLQYMSPEQFEGGSATLDIRTDVYSLGAVLYELLSGRPPHDVRAAALHEAVRIIREETPPRLGASAPDLEGDLETIATTALARDRERRYQSAADLGRDVERFLHVEPIEARRPTLLYQSRLFARRNRALVAATAAIIVCLVGAVAVSVASAVRASRAEETAIAERDGAVRRAYFGSMAAAESAWRGDEYLRMRTHLAEAPARYRGWEWHALSAAAEPSLAVIPHESFSDATAWSADGRWIATGDRDGNVWRVDPSSGAKRAVGRHERPVTAVAFSPDSSGLAAASDDGAVQIWDVERVEPIASPPVADSAIRCIAFGRDGRSVFTGARDGTLRRWMRDGSAGGYSVDLGATVRGLAISRDGARIATAQADGAVRVFTATTGRAEHAFDTGIQANDVEFDVGGTRLFSAHTDGAIRVWDAERGGPLGGFEVDAALVAIELNPAGSLLAAGGQGPSIRLLDPESGQEIRPVHGHAESIRDVAFSPDGARLVSASWDRTARIWNVEPALDLSTLAGHEGEVQSLAFSPDGRMLASSNGAGTIRIQDTRTHELVAELTGAGWGRPIAFSPDGRWLLHENRRHAIVLRDTATGEVGGRLAGHTRPLRELAFDPAGARLVSASADGTAIVWSFERREALHTLEGHARRVYRAAWTRDGARIVTASWDMTARIWDARTGAALHVLEAHDMPIYAMAMSPNGRRLATGGRDQTICLWDLDAGTLERRLSGHGQFVGGLAFHPDGSRFASASWTGTITVWDTADDTLVATLYPGRRVRFRSIAFSPDGAILAAGGHDGLIRIWHTASVAERLETRAAALAAEADAALLVDRLAVEHPGPAQVAAAIRADATLDADRRRTALNVLLRRTTTGSGSP